MENNDWDKIKKAVEDAKLQHAKNSGQIQQMVSTLNELGFPGDDCIKNANEYLDEYEVILDKEEQEIQKQKQQLSDEYTKIIQKTAPGAAEE